jgi:hypothetical protein
MVWNQPAFHGYTLRLCNIALGEVGPHSTAVTWVVAGCQVVVQALVQEAAGILPKGRSRLEMSV